LLPEHVAKNLDRRLLHDWQCSAVRGVPRNNRAGADAGQDQHPPEKRTAIEGIR
jgi:hypothetical protein